MAERDDLPYIVIERHSGGMVPFLWGALLGAGAALLWAPRSGEETQRELRREADRLRSAAEERINDTRDAFTDTVDRVRGDVETRVGAVRDAVTSGVEQARDAVGAGRRAARDTKTDLERRVAAAKEAVRSEPTFREPVPPREADVVITEVIIEEDFPGMG